MLRFFRKLARKGELFGRKLIGWEFNIKMILWSSRYEAVDWSKLG